MKIKRAIRKNMTAPNGVADGGTRASRTRFAMDIGQTGRQLDSARRASSRPFKGKNEFGPSKGRLYALCQVSKCK